jgi:ABC-type multidrug transport system fused ATPase/permease subunit
LVSAPDETLNPEIRSRVLLLWLWRDHIRKRFWPFAAALVLMAVEGASTGLLSYLVRPMFDQVFLGSDRTAVVYVAFAVAGVFSLRALAGFGQRLILARQAERISAGLQQALLTHIMTLDLGFFMSNAPGALIERVRGDTATLRGLWRPILSALGRDAVSLISLLGVALWIDWVWTLIAIMGVPLLILPLTWLQNRVRRTARVAREAAAVLATRLDETFHGITTIKLTGSAGNEAERYHRAQTSYLKAQFRSEGAAAAIPALIDMVAAIGFAGVMIYGGLQIMDGEKTLGEFMSFFVAMALVFEPLRRLGSVAGSWAQARASLERLRRVLDMESRLTDPDDPAPMPAGHDLALQDVQFAYDEVPVLQGVSFTARAGQVTALVGPSGAGKTTVFHLLTRLADPTAGKITLGGTDLRALDLAALRRHFAVVAQDTALFDESIAGNLRIGAPEASEAALQQALADANAGFVAGLPQGIDTPAGPRGSALSGGQRQRIAIARALLRDAPILLLDEATSALDAASEKLVAEALARLGTGRTTIVIAHRLATVRDADKIVVMDQGRVVDEGTHDALLQRDGLYAALYRLQFKDQPR